MVLLADAFHELRRLTRDILREGGFAVLEARSAAEALRIADDCNGPIDLLVTSSALPGMKCEELLQKLRVKRPSLPSVVMVSPEDKDSDKTESPCGSVLRKPFTPAMLLGIIERVLGSSKNPKLATE
jgi:DNA-binding response OmpR family regulator